MKQLINLVFGVFVSGLTVSSGQLIVAHRGASHDAPENTMAAFSLAWEQGADAIEGDFYLSKDGEIVCIHDADLKRTAGKDVTVAESTLAELRRYDVGSWKDKRFAAERIPTLAEVLAIVPEGKKILVEIKCGAEILPALEKAVDACKLNIAEQVVIISFNNDVVIGCRHVLPELKVNWLTGFKLNEETHTWSPTINGVMTSLKETRATGLGCMAEPTMVTPALVTQLRAAKLEFHCWTVDDVDLANYLCGLGIDSITTNRPGWLRAGLAP